MAVSNGEARRTTVAVQGARVHNLRNVDVEIPRDQLVVLTGVSGSGKSSLAFDTIYAEGQRRYLESLSSFAKRFITQVARPDVDYVFGLSPVISIEQKTIGSNPRSTVGTMTDIAGYLNLLFATIGEAQCPYCDRPIPALNLAQILDRLLAPGEGTLVELRAPVWPIYGEDAEVLFTEIRKQGYRHMLFDGAPVELSDEFETPDGDRAMTVIVDRVTLRAGREKELKTAVQNALRLGDPYLEVCLPEAPPELAERFYATWGCPEHHLLAGNVLPEFFMFNNPESACRTCSGLGTYNRVHPDLLVPDRSRSILEGAFIKDAWNPHPDNWDGRHAWSMAAHYGFRLDVPFRELPEEIVDILLWGTHGEKYTLLLPPEANPKNVGGWSRMIGKPIGFDGVCSRIERTYKHFRQRQTADTWVEQWISKLMVEHTCPDCEGTRLRASRQRFRVGGKTLHEVGQTNFSELRAWLGEVADTGSGSDAGQQVLREISARLDLLLGIGLDYLNFNRRSGTLSGGEAQRIRLSTQIGSGLMGMLYVLDEPSIGLHPKDNQKMIATLRRLRDLGNTVICVEHDEDTIRAADHIVEMGPGPASTAGRWWSRASWPTSSTAPNP